MGLFDSKHSSNDSGIDTATIQSTSKPTDQADQNHIKAEDDVKSALLELGEKYYEANLGKQDAEFWEEILKVKECIDKEELWHQYRLSLEGKTLCEHCGAIITSDSAFCNKCGGSIKPRDFSSIGIKEDSLETDKAKVCPSCGSPLVEDAMFCEKCGMKL